MPTSYTGQFVKGGSNTRHYNKTTYDAGKGKTHLSGEDLHKRSGKELSEAGKRGTGRNSISDKYLRNAINALVSAGAKTESVGSSGTISTASDVKKQAMAKVEKHIKKQRQKEWIMVKNSKGDMVKVVKNQSNAGTGSTGEIKPDTSYQRPIVARGETRGLQSTLSQNIKDFINNYTQNKLESKKAEKTTKGGGAGEEKKGKEVNLPTPGEWKTYQQSKGKVVPENVQKSLDRKAERDKAKLQETKPAETKKTSKKTKGGFSDYAINKTIAEQGIKTTREQAIEILKANKTAEQVNKEKKKSEKKEVVSPTDKKPLKVTKETKEEKRLKDAEKPKKADSTLKTYTPEELKAFNAKYGNKTEKPVESTKPDSKKNSMDTEKARKADVEKTLRNLETKKTDTLKGLKKGSEEHKNTSEKFNSAIKSEKNKLAVIEKNIQGLKNIGVQTTAKTSKQKLAEEAKGIVDNASKKKKSEESVKLTKAQEEKNRKIEANIKAKDAIMKRRKALQKEEARIESLGLNKPSTTITKNGNDLISSAKKTISENKKSEELQLSKTLKKQLTDKEIADTLSKEKVFANWKKQDKVVVNLDNKIYKAKQGYEKQKDKEREELHKLWSLNDKLAQAKEGGNKKEIANAQKIRDKQEKVYVKINRSSYKAYSKKEEAIKMEDRLSKEKDKKEKLFNKLQDRRRELIAKGE